MTGPPRGRDRWLLAGQELLRRGGLPAVRLDALAAEAGVTTGSFYHHFTGMPAYLDALARFYGADQVEAALAGIAAADPVDRLRRLARLASDERMHPLDVAMRDWAGTSPAAADSVRAADAALLRFVERAFLDLGLAVAAARVRAVVLLSVGVARVHAPWPVPASTADDVLRLLCPPGEDGP